jgi:hypothetical protein
MILKKILILFTILGCSEVFAAKGAVYIDLARSKKYIGGRDESDLKVQLKLYQPPSKNNKPVKPEPNEGF